MANHSSILAWRIPMDRGAWQGVVQRVSESDTTEATQYACMHSHSHPQGIFLTQGWTPDLLHCKPILCSLNHQGSPYVSLSIFRYIYKIFKISGLNFRNKRKIQKCKKKKKVSLFLIGSALTEPTSNVVKVLVTQSCPILCNPMDCSHQLLCLWNSPGKNTGVGCHFLLQGGFLTQGLNPGLPHCKQTLLTESPGKPLQMYAHCTSTQCFHHMGDVNLL